MNSLRLLRKLGIAVRHSIGGSYLFHLIEKKCVKRAEKLRVSPIFIIGAPRTGSTMLFQLLTQKFQFAYISNVASIFYKSPFLYSRLFLKKILAKNKQNLHNEHGLVKGLYSPSEAAKVFKLWFEDKKFIENNCDFIINSVYALSNLFGGPFICKNLSNSTRLDEIYKLFPEALFIHIQRNTLFTAQSILLSRKKINKTDEKWWSTKPLTYNELKNLNKYQQVIRQVVDLNQHILDFKKSHPDVNYIQLTYEDVCEQPNKSINTIKQWYTKRKYNLIDKKEIKQKIHKSEKIKLPEDEWEGLIKNYNKVIKNGNQNNY